MGLVLSFAPAARKPLTRRAAEIPQGGADILFFTGVRYAPCELPYDGRDGESSSRAGKPRTARRRRRTPSGR